MLRPTFWRKGSIFSRHGTSSTTICHGTRCGSCSGMDESIGSGSPHRDVYVRCFFPDKRLNDLLDLESRIRRKLKQAAASIGVEHEVIPGAATGEQVFAETREEIEKLKNEDATILENAGEDPLAHSRRGVPPRSCARAWNAMAKRRSRNCHGAQVQGSSMVARPAISVPKVGERVFLRFVPADGDAIVKDTLGCLKLIAMQDAILHATSRIMLVKPRMPPGNVRGTTSSRSGSSRLTANCSCVRAGMKAAEITFVSIRHPDLRKSRLIG